MNPVRASLEAAVLGAAAALARGLGATGARRLGAALGAAWHLLDLRHRRIARENLCRALPGLSDRQRASIARGSFRHFGSVMIDLLRFPAYTREDCERMTRVAGWEHLEKALSLGRGVLLFSGHYGHWELIALLQGFRGRPLDMITRPLDNPALEQRMARARTRSGNRVIHKRTAVRGILRGLREDRTVAVVIDQNFRDPNRVFVDFFGRPAATTPTLGVLAVRTGAPVVPVFSWPGADGCYRIQYHPAVSMKLTGDRSEDALRLTQVCTGLLEAQVRKHPEYWLWMHERWRTRPAGRAEVLGTAVPGKAEG